MSRAYDEKGKHGTPIHSRTFKMTIKIIDTWLGTEFSSAERHMRRLKKMEEIEKQEFGA